jgi:hypothetical protein
MTLPPWAEKRRAGHSSLEIQRPVKPAGRVVLALVVVDTRRLRRILVILRIDLLFIEWKY